MFIDTDTITQNTKTKLRELENRVSLIPEGIGNVKPEKTGSRKTSQANLFCKVNLFSDIIENFEVLLI